MNVFAKVAQFVADVRAISGNIPTQNPVSSLLHLAFLLASDKALLASYQASKVNPADFLTVLDELSTDLKAAFPAPLVTGQPPTNAPA